MRIGDGGSTDHAGGYSSAFRMTGRYDDSVIGGFCNAQGAVFPPLGFRGGGFANFGNTNRIGGEDSRVGGLELVRWPGFYTNSSNGGQESINPASEQLLLLQQQQQQQQQQEQQLQQNSCNSSGKRRGGVASRPCQDCGNQAKKECMNMRCRTCCRSRGFDCPTHMRSTWVPATKRRERKQLHNDAAPMPNRARILALAPPKSSSPQPSNSGTAKVVTTSIGFPSKVRASVAMKCVKVLGLDEHQPHHQVYAYKARVKIADHIFQGMLYDEDVQTSPKRRRAEVAPSVGAIGAGERMPTPTTLGSLMEHQPSSGLRFVNSSDSTLLQDGGF